MSDTILRVKNIIKDFPGQRALDKVTFDVQHGEIHALIGENGAGKSTLIKILAGFYRADRGEILIDGKLQRYTTPRESEELGLAFIHQDLNLVPHLSAAENILLGSYPLTKLNLVSQAKMVKKAEKIPDALSIGADLTTPAERLSVIQQWKVAINRALGLKSRIIFMDEPTASLTYDEVNELFKSIDHLKKLGKAIVYVSHRMEEIFRIADRMTIIKDAKNVGTVSVKETEPEQIYRMMLGREMAEIFPDRKKPRENVCLEIKNLTRKDVVNNVSFMLNSGEILGIAGLVGAGRTELARLIFGADKKDRGSISINGKMVSIKSPADAINNGVALIPEERRDQGLILQMDIKQNITLPSLYRIIRRKIIPLLSRRKEQYIAQRLADAVEIKPRSLNVLVEYVSGGNQQKVVLAKWLCSKARIFIFDEPTKGIDVGAKFAIYKLIVDLARDGAGVIIISSDLQEVVGLSHRILVMDKGTIKANLMDQECNLQSVIRICLDAQTVAGCFPDSASETVDTSAHQIR